MRLHSHKSKTGGCWEHAESQFVVMYMQDKTITSGSVMINNEKTTIISNKQNKQHIISDHETSLTPGRETYFCFCQSLMLAVYLMDNSCITFHILHITSSCGFIN